MKTCKHCGCNLDDLAPNKSIGLQCYTCKNGLDRYSMNRLDMIKLYESQNKCCALCDKPVELFSRRARNSGYIDHCHKTGKIRAILCHPCNTSLGYIERNLDLIRLQKYIGI